MATLRLDLSNLSVIDNKFYIIDANKTNLKYAGYKLEGISDKAVTFADGSTLTIDSSDKFVFTAASGTGTFAAAVAEVTDADIEKLATKANDIAEAAVKKLDTSANVAAKKKAATLALTAAAEKAGKNTLAYEVYTRAADQKNLNDNGSVNVNSLKPQNIFSPGISELPIPATLDFTNAGAVTYDASKYISLEKLNGSAYADKLTVGAATQDLAVNAGEGNDVVTVNGIDNDKTHTIDLGDGDDILNITDKVTLNNGEEATVDAKLGDGKDVVNVASNKVSVNISDYNYADGDKINLTYSKSDTLFTPSGNAKLDTISASEGKLTVGNITATVKAFDNVAAANVSGEKQTVTFFTATDDKKEVEINAKGIVNETRIDASTSKLANITLGSGQSNVLLADTGYADVINATGAGKVTVMNFTNKEDTLILDGANLSNIKLATVNKGKVECTELTYGKTTVELLYLKQNNEHTINLNDSKLAFDLKGSETLETGADMYYGNADKTTTVETTGNVHLTETDKYKNIYKVSVKAADVKADKLDLSGFTTSGTTGININASQSDVGVNVWAYNKNAMATDTINLSKANSKQDTVSFASDDGKVSVADFGFGSGEESDILYLRDTKDLQKLAVKSGEIKLGNSKATIGHATNVNDLMQVKLADGTTSLVAANFNTDTAKAGSIDVTLTSTQAVDFYALTGTKNTLTVTKASSLDDAVNFKYSNFDANHTTGTLVKSINASGFTNENDEVTIGAVANATVAGSTKSHIWVCGAAESGTVDVSGNSGKDQIDFVSGIDKKVTVTGYKAADDDTIYLRGAEDLKAVTAGYKFESKNGGIQITGVDNAASRMVLEGATDGNLNLKTLNGSKLKAIVSTADATFSTDTQIYAGMKRIVADMSTEGDIAVRVGTKGKIGLDSSNTYYVGNTVTEFDGSNSNAVFHLAGSSTAATTLRGGNTKNSFYGGGSFNDTMVGNSSAVDTFYFGKGDGKDTIMEADGKDTVYLMNATLEEITVDAKKNVINIGANDTLTFGKGAEAALTAGELTFNIGGSNYVCKDGKFVAKEA